MFFQDGRSIQYTYDKNGNILRSVVSVIVDTDADGMDDSWENTHFGNMSRIGGEDFDSDGQSDRHEFLAGTDPKDPASVLALNTVPEIRPGSVTLMWNAAPGKRYRVDYKNDLSDPNWTALDGVVEASGQVGFKTDPTASSSERRFYRVSLVEP